METILSWYRSGGPLIAPLLFVGVAGLAIIIERFSYIVLRSRINARPFIEKIVSLVRAGRTDEALKLCAEHRSALPDVGLVILRGHVGDEADLRIVAEASSRNVVPGLMQRLPWLPTLAQAALLLGILGGVFNLHDALMALARTARTGDPGTMANAVAYALRPVGVGVMTAIPLIVAHTFLLGEAQRIAMQLEEFSSRLVNALTDRPDVRLGHR